MQGLIGASLSERYDPVKIVGHGSFAIVVQAVDRRTGDLVAIKHIQNRGSDRTKFFRELQLTTRLRHSNIVRFIDLDCSDDRASNLVFEFADGGSLRETMVEGTGSSLEQALQILSQVSAGVAHAHEQGVLHRDLKPENILIFRQSSGVVYKVADFGIARILGTHEKAMTSIGSPAYMAPEQFYDAYDLKSDVYALGVLLFELLHGKAPFEGNAAAVFRGHLEDSIPFAATVEDRVRALVSHMMAKKPADRPSIGEVRREIDMLAQALELRPPPGPAAPASTPPGGAPPSAESLFGEMFGGLGDRMFDADTAHDPTMPPPAVFTRRTPTPPQPGAAEPILFGGEVGEEAPAPEPIPESMPSLSAPVVEESSLRGSDLFGAAFGEAAAGAPPLARSERQAAPGGPLEVGGLRVQRLWSRVVDTRAKAIVNLRDGKELLLLREGGLHLLKPNGAVGAPVLEITGSQSMLGTPSHGVLPLLLEGAIRALHRSGLAERQWFVDRDIDRLVTSPDLGAVAVSSGGMVFCHDAEGNHLWTGQFEAGEHGLFLSFDAHGRLMVLALRGADHTVHYLDRDGGLLASHATLGPIAGASRAEDDGSAWLVVKRGAGHLLLRVTPEGQHLIGAVPVGLHNLAGGASGLLGVDDAGVLHLLDPESGATAPLGLEGQAIAYEEGLHDGELYVLEQRGELLRYVSAYRVERRGEGNRDSQPISQEAVGTP